MNNFRSHSGKPLLQGLHVATDPRVQQLGIVLGGLDIGMPSIFETVSIGTLLANVTVVANVCRAMWNVSFLVMPHRSAISFR